MQQTGRGEQDHEPADHMVRLELLLGMAKGPPRHPGQEHGHEDVQASDRTGHHERDGRFHTALGAPPGHSPHKDGEQGIEQT